jgi:hypothetical protein
MASTLKYETKSCGRCGGSGSYSYNSMHGSVCYGCSGRKTVLTKAGAKAAAAVTGFIAEHFSVAVEDLTVGTRIKIDGVHRTVSEITHGPGGSYTGPDGATVVVTYYTVSWVKPIRSTFGPLTSHGFPMGTKVVKAVAGADWDRVVAFARTLKKGVTVAEAVAA